MNGNSGSDTPQAKNETTVERTSDLDLVVTRTVNGPVHLVYEAWTRADLFRKWWVPRSYGLNLQDCEMDVRVGGQYRLVFLHEGSTMAFFGTYIEVVPNARLAWTNDEGDAGTTITTVTFEDRGSQTIIVIHDRYPSTAAMESGATGALPETLDQLDEFLASLASPADAG
jgi:uncharacterized protein YndB with AHSA1/START domain